METVATVRKDCLMFKDYKYLLFTHSKVKHRDWTSPQKEIKPKGTDTNGSIGIRYYACATITVSIDRSAAAKKNRKLSPSHQEPRPYSVQRTPSKQLREQQQPLILIPDDVQTTWPPEPHIPNKTNIHPSTTEAKSLTK